MVSLTVEEYENIRTALSAESPFPSEYRGTLWAGQISNSKNHLVWCAGAEATPKLLDV